MLTLDEQLRLRGVGRNAPLRFTRPHTGRVSDGSKVRQCHRYLGLVSMLTAAEMRDSSVAQEELLWYKAKSGLYSIKYLWSFSGHQLM
jgi:hypothetical protein